MLRLVLRGLLSRGVVLLEAFFALSAASTIHHLADYGADIVPAVVVRAVVVLLGSGIALRASFGSDATAGWRFCVFVLCQVAVIGAATGVVGPPWPADEFVVAGSVLPPNEIYGSRFVISTTRFAFVLAAALAFLSVPVELWRLGASRDAVTLRPVPFGLGVWIAAAALATGVVAKRYTASFTARQRPEAKVEMLFVPVRDIRQRWRAAEILAALPQGEQEAVHAALVAGLSRGEPCEQAWAAYVLIAQGRDDGAAMIRLREILRTPQARCATMVLNRVAPQAAPALPELLDLVRAPVRDMNDNLRLADVAYLLGQIGSPAAAAVPRLFALVRDERHAQVRYAAAGAIDRIEPAYAARCVVDATTVLEALEDTAPSGRPLAVRAECAR